jgi:hypothetical protein
MPFFGQWWPPIKGVSDTACGCAVDQGRLIGRMESLRFKLREEAVLQTLTQDVLKTSEIEGEALDATQVRSSLARRLGIDIGALPRPTATLRASSR